MVEIPKEVADAIEVVWPNYIKGFHKKHLVLTNWNLLRDRHPNQIKTLFGFASENPIEYMQALVNGYTVKQEPITVTITPKQQERLKTYIEVLQKDGFRQRAEVVQGALRIIGIEIKGVNDNDRASRDH